MTERELKFASELLHKMNALMSTFDRIISGLSTSQYVTNNIVDMMNNDMSIVINQTLNNHDVESVEFTLGFTVKRDLAGLVSAGLPIDSTYTESYIINNKKGIFNKSKAIASVKEDENTIIDISYPYISSISLDKIVFIEREDIIKEEPDDDNKGTEEERSVNQES